MGDVLEIMLTTVESTYRYPKHFVVTYTVDGLSFPRYRDFSTEALALDFMATLEGDDK